MTLWSSGTGQTDRIQRRPWRKNVLWLFAFGYLTIVFVFVALSTSDKLDVIQAGDLVQGPLMALIGGSIAVAKDLLQIDRDDAGHDPSANDLAENENKDGSGSGNGHDDDSDSDGVKS